MSYKHRSDITSPCIIFYYLEASHRSLPFSKVGIAQGCNTRSQDNWEVPESLSSTKCWCLQLGLYLCLHHVQRAIGFLFTSSLTLISTILSNVLRTSTMSWVQSVVQSWAKPHNFLFSGKYSQKERENNYMNKCEITFWQTYGNLWCYERMQTWGSDPI